MSQGPSRPRPEPAPDDWPEVKRHLIRLVSLITVGVVVMVSVAAYVWVHYGGSRAVINRPEPVDSATIHY